MKAYIFLPEIFVAKLLDTILNIPVSRKDNYPDKFQTTCYWAVFTKTWRFFFFLYEEILAHLKLHMETFPYFLGSFYFLILTFY